MKDTIYIRDLRVETIIGIFGWEREVRQQISMDLDFEFDVSVPVSYTHLRAHET